jgi:hypothetical protein
MPGEAEIVGLNNFILRYGTPEILGAFKALSKAREAAGKWTQAASASNERIDYTCPAISCLKGPHRGGEVARLHSAIYYAVGWPFPNSRTVFQPVGKYLTVLVAQSRVGKRIAISERIAVGQRVSIGQRVSVGFAISQRIAIDSWRLGGTSTGT